jgi:hypothetical protein
MKKAIVKNPDVGFGFQDAYQKLFDNKNKHVSIESDLIFHLGGNKKAFLTLIKQLNSSGVELIDFLPSSFANTATHFADKNLTDIYQYLVNLTSVKTVCISNGLSGIPANSPDYTIFTPYGVGMLLNGLQSNPSIEALKFINGGRINEAGLITLMNGLKNTSIKELVFSSSWPFIASVNLLKSLSDALKYSKLEKIADGESGMSGYRGFLSGKIMTIDGMCILMEGLIGSKLNSLDIRDCSITDECAAILAANIKDTNITELIITRDDMSVEGISILFNGLINSKIKSLDFTGLTHGTMPPYNSNHPLFTDEYTVTLSDILRKTSIEHLSLSFICYTDKGRMALFDGLVGSSVKSIKIISEKPSSDEEISYISNLLKFTCIEILKGYPSLTDTQVPIFFKGLIGSNIKELNFSTKTITDLGISKIAPFLKHTFLESLVISGTNKTEITIKSRDVISESIYGSFLKNLGVGIYMYYQCHPEHMRDKVFGKSILQNELLISKIQKFYDYLNSKFDLVEDKELSNIYEISEFFSIKENANPVIATKTLMLMFAKLGNELLVYEARDYYHKKVGELRTEVDANNINDKLLQLTHTEEQYGRTPLFLLKYNLFKTVGSKLPLNHNIMSVILQYLDAQDLCSLIMVNSDGLSKKTFTKDNLAEVYDQSQEVDINNIFSIFNQKTTEPKKDVVQKSHILGKIKGEIKEVKTLFKFKISLDDILKEMKFLNHDNLEYIQDHLDETETVIMGGLDINEDFI